MVSDSRVIILELMAGDIPGHGRRVIDSNASRGNSSSSSSNSK